MWFAETQAEYETGWPEPKASRLWLNSFVIPPPHAITLFLSYVVTQATRKTAAQYVLESCLADEVFWRSMLDLGVIRFAESSDVG